MSLQHTLFALDGSKSIGAAGGLRIRRKLPSTSLLGSLCYYRQQIREEPEAGFIAFVRHRIQAEHLAA